MTDWLLLKQGRPSVAEEGYCRLRGHDNCACAIGCLIPDSDYKEELETGLSMSGATQLRVYLIDKGFELILLMKLQNVHDSCRRPDWSLAQWQESLVKLPYSIGFLKNNEKFKHLAYDTLQMKVPGVERTEADIYRIAEECQRGS